MHAGTYGTCERCRGPIGERRLAARPVARTCITCAA
ncbi:TraR/DksA family transcriptional regulator [Phytoactinopolyspora alkaliphila]